jgi:hypothetical protein
VRDGKTKGIKFNGLISGLTKELTTSALREGGYPDSDDDDDDDEEDDEDTEKNGCHIKFEISLPLMEIDLIIIWSIYLRQ